jgi:hypothetical protein
MMGNLLVVKASPSTDIGFARKDFLEALFGAYFERHKGFIEVQAFVPFADKPRARFFPNVEALAKEPFPENHELFFGICPREKMKHRGGNIRYINALWAALDIGDGGYSRKDAFQNCQQAARAVRNFPLRPSIVVESGQGIHLYWLLNQPMIVFDVTKIQNALKRISVYFNCKRDMNIEAMLRLPGTFNNKPPMKRACKIKYTNSELRYTPEEFDQCLATLKQLGIHLTD